MLYYIYKITCKNESSDDLYVGSTKNFRMRLKSHKYNCHNENCKGYNYNLYQVIRENGGWDNWSMEIIEEVEVDFKDDAEIIEEEYRVKLKANLNSIRCFRTHEELLEQHRESCKKYHENNREKELEYKRNWREEHKEELSIKHDCVCGGKYTYRNKARHFRTEKHQKYLNENKMLTN